MQTENLIPENDLIERPIHSPCFLNAIKVQVQGGKYQIAILFSLLLLAAKIFIKFLYQLLFLFPQGLPFNKVE